MIKLKVTLAFLFFLPFAGWSQETPEKPQTADTAKIYDNELSFYVVSEQMRKYGEIEVCVFSDKVNMCVGNLTTSFEIHIFDANDQLLAKSIWLGMNLNIKFKKNYPKAKYLEIKAVKPFVINKTTGSKIYQDEPISGKFTLK